MARAEGINHETFKGGFELGRFTALMCFVTSFEIAASTFD